MTSPRILAVIPARGGSKGLPHKNIRDACGKPLIAWTIEAAQKSRYISRLVLSSDDTEIIKAAQRFGCDVPFVRPKYLASDTASSIDVIHHAIKEIPGYDYVILLQPTSPLRTTSDIDNAVEMMLNKGAPACVGITESTESPYWMMVVEKNEVLKPLIDRSHFQQRRQDLPNTYLVNGAIYIAEINWLMRQSGFVGPETIGYRMPKERSIDIDTEEDFRQLLSLLDSVRKFDENDSNSLLSTT
jgi:CMP-N,N'-diacetyllegionaminic acid synthase